MRKLTYATLVAALSTLPFPAPAEHNAQENGNGHFAANRMTGSDQAASRVNDRATTDTNRPGVTGRHARPGGGVDGTN